MGKMKNLVIELAELIPADEESVMEACESEELRFFENSEELAKFMKSRKDKESSIDIYQMDNGMYAIDTSLISRKQGER